jgi:hypothetical protein
MPIETKKVLWTALSVLIVLVVAFGIALALVVPKGDSAMAPASIGSTTPPRVAAPDAYIRTAEPAPVPPAPGSTSPAADSGVIIVYGEKPATPALPATTDPVSQSTPGASASTTTAPAAAAKPYTPAPPATSTPKNHPQTPAAAKPAAAAKACCQYNGYGVLDTGCKLYLPVTGRGPAALPGRKRPFIPHHHKGNRWNPLLQGAHRSIQSQNRGRWLADQGTADGRLRRGLCIHADCPAFQLI